MGNVLRTAKGLRKSGMGQGAYAENRVQLLWDSFNEGADMYLPVDTSMSVQMQDRNRAQRDQLKQLMQKSMVDATRNKIPFTEAWAKNYAGRVQTIASHLRGEKRGEALFSLGSVIGSRAKKPDFKRGYSARLAAIRKTKLANILNISDNARKNAVGVLRAAGYSAYDPTVALRSSEDPVQVAQRGHVETALDQMLFDYIENRMTPEQKANVESQMGTFLTGKVEIDGVKDTVDGHMRRAGLGMSADRIWNVTEAAVLMRMMNNPALSRRLYDYQRNNASHMRDKNAMSAVFTAAVQETAAIHAEELFTIWEGSGHTTGQMYNDTDLIVKSLELHARVPVMRQTLRGAVDPAAGYWKPYEKVQLQQWLRY